MNRKLAAVALATSWLLAGCFGEAPFATPDGQAECTDFASVRVRRLTRTEFNATAAAALGFGVTEGSSLAAEDRVLGFTTHDRLEVSPLFADQLETVSLQLASKASERATCPTGTAEADCARSFIDGFVPKAYRRPVTSEERTQLLALYQVGRDGTDYKTGIQAVVQAVLESSSFLYRTELGAGDGAGLKALTPPELASALSYLLTAGPPDAELQAAAEAGSLADGAERGEAGAPPVETAAAKTQLKDFVVQWMGLGDVSSVQKNNNVFPDFSPALRDSMKAESERFIENVLAQDKARLTELLAADYTFADSTLAQFYGLPDRPGTTPAKVALPATRAGGLLTQAGLLSIYGHPDQSSPILRGKLVRTRLLCGTIPPPPPTVVAAAPPTDANKTTRSRVEAHTSNASCAGCHSQLDPIGFGMEDFDGIGKYRTMENGITVDATGQLDGTRDAEHQGAFTGAAQLARLLSTNSDVSDCANTQLFRFTMGRQEQALDACSLQPALSSFRGNELDLRELMVAYVRSPGFAQRRAVTP